MISKKNNDLKFFKNPKLCDLHNRRERLNMSKVMSKKKTRHLFAKTVFRKIKFVFNENTDLDMAVSHIYVSEKIDLSMSKIDTVHDVIKWLKSEGYNVKRISKKYYLFENKTVTESFLVVIANRKRVKKKLAPFVLKNDDPEFL